MSFEVIKCNCGKVFRWKKDFKKHADENRFNPDCHKSNCLGSWGYKVRCGCFEV